MKPRRRILGMLTVLAFSISLILPTLSTANPKCEKVCKQDQQLCIKVCKEQLKDKDRKALKICINKGCKIVFDECMKDCTGKK